MQRLVIDMESVRAYQQNAKYKNWIISNRLQDCFLMVALDDELLQWQAVFYARDAEGKLFFDEIKNMAATEQRVITVNKPPVRSWCRMRDIADPEPEAVKPKRGKFKMRKVES
jgi:hypothetical protein